MLLRIYSLILTNPPTVKHYLRSPSFWTIAL